MDDKEKNQKTVVAFIAGLLIGGLLVWVFSIAPKDEKQELKTNDGGEKTVEQTNSSIETVGDASASPTTTMPPVAGKRAATVVADGDASVAVADQAAGVRVALEALVMPVDNGWVVIHEVNADGSIGNALGASRYSKSEGLTPKSVELLRAMSAGMSYQAVLYSDNGDKIFNLAEDGALIKGETKVSDSFAATGA